jgi:hypothetical protein
MSGGVHYSDADNRLIRLGLMRPMHGPEPENTEAQRGRRSVYRTSFDQSVDVESPSRPVVDLSLEVASAPPVDQQESGRLRAEPPVRAKTTTRRFSVCCRRKPITYESLEEPPESTGESSSAAEWYENDRCQVYSKSARAWCDAVVVEVQQCPDGECMVRVSYHKSDGGGNVTEKVLLAASSDLRQASTARSLGPVSQAPSSVSLLSQPAGPLAQPNASMDAAVATRAHAASPMPLHAAAPVAAATGSVRSRPLPNFQSSPPTSFRPIGPDGRRRKVKQPGGAYPWRRQKPGPLMRTLSADRSSPIVIVQKASPVPR